MCAVFTTALLFTLVFSSSALVGVDYYRPDNSFSMYEDISFTVTQYLDTADEGAFNGMTVSKTFTSLDGTVGYYEPNDNYYITFYPFRGDWYYDEFAGYFNSGGYFDVTIQLPFKSSQGQLFDVAKLNDSAYLKHLYLYFNCMLQGINQRSFTCYLHLSSGGKLLLTQDTINDVSSGYYVIDADADIKCSELDYFEFSFRYYGLPQKYIPFEFVMGSRSYLEVHDISKIEQSIIDSNNSQIDNVQNQVGSLVGQLDTPKPNDNDVNSALDNIDIGAVDSFGSLVGVNSSSHVNFQRFIIAIIGSVSGVAFIGYVLHGKRG